jgi:hypothetical protein
MRTREQDGIERSAVFDDSGRYRYSLQRRWPASTPGPDANPGPKLVFIMLNPSRADANRDDPTLRACMQFARGWGYPLLEVVNLFAYCTPFPQQLQTVADPVGPGCDRYLLQAAASAERIILAWGNYGTLQDRDQTVLRRLQFAQPKLFCLGVNQSGQPRHPLYVPRTSQPVHFRLPVGMASPDYRDRQTNPTKRLPDPLK